MNHLQKFQQENSLTPDGIIGPMTLRKMQAVWKLPRIEHLTHHLGQMSHESLNFTKEVENLNYSAQGLANTWPYRYAVDPKAKVKYPNALAFQLQRNPMAIANNCYANRMGNGSESSGDGWLYRGRTATMRTGKNNYIIFSKVVNDPCVVTHPDTINEKYYFESGLSFFEENNLWKLCDNVSVSSITALSKRINGGTIGLQDRIDKTLKFHGYLKG